MTKHKITFTAVTAVLSLILVLSSGPASPAQQSSGQQRTGQQQQIERQDQQRQVDARTPSARNSDAERFQTRLAEQIRSRLVTLPYYDVFDWLEGDVQTDGTVVLRGQVVRPTTKSGAESRVRDLEGVERVVNEIEVLPVSQNDVRLRTALYRAIFGYNSPLFRYATRAVPPIHIIVRNGRATLKGVVARAFDSQLAYTKARGVPGVFEVKNELRVENSDER
jgi:hyperosmotically inducible protein